MLVIGKVKRRALKPQVSRFAHRVDAFKAGRARPAETGDGFVPEFSGKRKSYSIDTVEGECDHGLIVSALERSLRPRGLRCGNDRNRDLFVVSSRRRTRYLFEVKTDGSPYAIYTAVGQLMLHAASGRLVCPENHRVAGDAVRKGDGHPEESRLIGGRLQVGARSSALPRTGARLGVEAISEAPRAPERLCVGMLYTPLHRREFFRVYERRSVRAFTLLSQLRAGQDCQSAPE